MTKSIFQPTTWPLRWRYAIGCFLLGVLYSLTALVVGVEATFRGTDVTLWVGAVVEASFAGFGYLLGLNAEARRREQRSADVIETQLRDLATVRARLAQSERLASLGELAGAIVHEVRNPLAIIRSMAQNLEESLVDRRVDAEDEAEALDVCRQIRDEVDRLARVTSSLSSFSRRPALRRRPLEVADLATRVRLLASELLDARDVELRLEPPDQPVDDFNGDEDLLTQVLLGLVANAAEETAPGGVVRLGWRWRNDSGRNDSGRDDSGRDDSGREGSLEITVADEGPGVPEDLRERVFDPFFTTRADGHGLGLAVARQIVRAHGGEIKVDSGADRGAVFRLRLEDAE